LFSVGFNGFGCIGDSTYGHSSKINQIEYFSDIFDTDVVCGYTHCLAISNNGEIYSWVIISLTKLETIKMEIMKNN
jgi:alpha-tubulin suppressor-like RCC1 family protein